MSIWHKHLGFILTIALVSGCAAFNKTEFDKAALMETKKVAVIGYDVPTTIKYSDDPKGESKGGLLQLVSEVASANNGQHAATLAHNSFINELNNSGISMTFLSQKEMMANSQFKKVAAKYSEILAKRKAEAATKMAANDSGMGKALGFMAKMSTATGQNINNESAAPKGLPAFGLVPNWGSANTAIVNPGDQMNYIKEALAALGVDGVMIINDPGMSFACNTCIGGTGKGSTGSAFLVTLLDKDSESIMQMRQWFVYSDGDAAMVSYAVNPTAHDELFEGHGTKMARVLVDAYKAEGGM